MRTLTNALCCTVEDCVFVRNILLKTLCIIIVSVVYLWLLFSKTFLLCYAALPANFIRTYFFQAIGFPCCPMYRLLFILFFYPLCRQGSHISTIVLWLGVLNAFCLVAKWTALNTIGPSCQIAQLMNIRIDCDVYVGQIMNITGR